MLREVKQLYKGARLPMEIRDGVQGSELLRASLGSAPELKLSHQITSTECVTLAPAHPARHRCLYHLTCGQADRTQRGPV